MAQKKTAKEAAAGLLKLKEAELTKGLKKKSRK